MFAESLKRLLRSHFRQPARERKLAALSQAIIQTTRYKIPGNLVRALKAENIIQSHRLKAKNGKVVTLYTSSALEDLTPYEIAFGMYPDGYFCNFTSIYYHALTNQVPKSIYICHETIEQKASNSQSELTDQAIRGAFIKPHRVTSLVYSIGESEIIVVDRKKGSAHGVTKVDKAGDWCPSGARITGIERALIDAVVGPQYNGGINSVFMHFKAASTRINIKKLLDIYGRLKFSYPYFQAIGFLLERSGMSDQANTILKTYTPKQKFFLDHNAKTSWKFDEKWRIFFPGSLIDENR